MAKVKYPLHSLSASGSIGGQITYNKVGEQDAKIIRRTIDGDQIDASYPPRIISGQGIAKLKIRHRRDIPKRKARTINAPFPNQSDIEALFRLSSLIASWMVRNRLSISPQAPVAGRTNTPPAHHGYLLGRAENRELRRFPGQEAGSTVSIRREITAPKNGYTHLMHLLLTASFSRFVITARHWQALGRTGALLWAPSGTAPWDKLPETFTVPIAGTINRTFINIWIQLSYLVPQFNLPREWFTIGQQNALWINPEYTEQDNPNYPAYLAYIEAQNDSTAIQQKPWIPTTR